MEEKMSKKDGNVANVPLCLQKIGECLDAIPSNEGDPVDKELLQRKKVAEKALDHLQSLLSEPPQNVIMSVCKEGEAYL
jgi:hypothetical protein